jgi:elongation factor 1 alpha-like protein
MDQVSWSQDRYDEIVDALRPFLVSAGFTASKTTFLPLGAMEGVNVLVNEEALLKEWYNGPTLIDTLGQCKTLKPSYRDVIADAQFRPSGSARTTVREPVEDPGVQRLQGSDGRCVRRGSLRATVLWRPSSWR